MLLDAKRSTPVVTEKMVEDVMGASCEFGYFTRTEGGVYQRTSISSDEARIMLEAALV
ncbi:hypothetical protein D3C87_2210640 [compost metagenome]